MRQVTHALLTRPPLSHFLFRRRKNASFDLHVLSTPPAFILSQDQTLILKVVLQNSLSLFFRFTSFDVYCCLGAIFLQTATVFRLCSFWIILSNLSRLFHCSVINVLFAVLLTAYLLYLIYYRLSRTFLFIFHKFLPFLLAERFISYHLLLPLSTAFFHFPVGFSFVFSFIFRWSASRCLFFLPMFCWHVLRSACI